MTNPPSPGLWSQSWTDMASSDVHSCPLNARYCSSGLSTPARGKAVGAWDARGTWDAWAPRVRVGACGHAVVAGDGPAVEAEALRVLPLRDNQRLVVEPVALPTERGDVWNELRVSEQSAERVAVGLGPGEHPAHVHARAARI